MSNFNCSSRLQSSCSVCPSGFFCPMGASQPIECPAGTQADEGASECTIGAAAAVDTVNAIAFIVTCIVLADLIHALIFYRSKHFHVTDCKNIRWILASLMVGPLIWFIWWYYMQRCDPRQFQNLEDSVELSVHSSATAVNLDSAELSVDSPVTALVLPRVTFRDIKINKHVKEKRGGAGIVSQVTWKGNNYAMKRPLFVDQMTARDEAKFVKELGNQARLQHPNCVKVYAVCLERNNVFFLMEWMHGGSLWEQLLNTKKEMEILTAQQCGGAAASSGPVLSARKRLQIAREICDGLQYMHYMGMVHGDIKSLNVMLGKKGNAKLCDFGLTTMELTTSAASTTSLGGTAAWCAPEILCQGQRHTPRSDIYSLGMLMYELLMCAPPFEGLPNNQISGLLHNNQRPPIPDTIPSGFSPAFVTLMTRCWDQDPAQRPSAAEVHQCMIVLDESTRPNEPVELFPSGHQLPGSSQHSIVPCLKDALPEQCCDPVIQAIAAEAERSILTPSVQHMIAKHSLAVLEAQSIFVYTASQDYAVCPTHNAPYVSYNAALRSLKPHSVSVWSNYSFLLYNALLKLPSVACTVYRGLDCPLSDLSHLYWKGGFVWYAQPTSTTTDKDTTMQKFGEGANYGVGTFMELRVVNAKDIETFSAVPRERERLIPQNTCFRVLQALSAADVALLGSFGKLPPNVDLVVVEEVHALKC